MAERLSGSVGVANRSTGGGSFRLSAGAEGGLSMRIGRPSGGQTFRSISGETTRRFSTPTLGELAQKANRLGEGVRAPQVSTTIVGKAVERSTTPRVVPASHFGEFTPRPKSAKKEASVAIPRITTIFSEKGKASTRESARLGAAEVGELAKNSLPSVKRALERRQELAMLRQKTDALQAGRVLQIVNTFEDKQFQTRIKREVAMIVSHNGDLSVAKQLVVKPEVAVKKKETVVSDRIQFITRELRRMQEAKRLEYVTSVGKSVKEQKERELQRQRYQRMDAVFGQTKSVLKTVAILQEEGIDVTPGSLKATLFPTHSRQEQIVRVEQSQIVRKSEPAAKQVISSEQKKHEMAPVMGGGIAEKEQNKEQREPQFVVDEDAVSAREMLVFKKVIGRVLTQPFTGESDNQLSGKEIAAEIEANANDQSLISQIVRGGKDGSLIAWKNLVAAIPTGNMGVVMNTAVGYINRTLPVALSKEGRRASHDAVFLVLAKFLGLKEDKLDQTA